MSSLSLRWSARLACLVAAALSGGCLTLSRQTDSETITLDDSTRDRAVEVLRSGLAQEDPEMFWVSIHAAEGLTLGGYGDEVIAYLEPKLQTDQASADLKVAEARAEERRAMAVAQEQEMKAKAQEARAKVIEAETEIPKAMAEAFRTGNLGIMDYYKMQNIQSDTSMRDSISGSGSKKSKGSTSKGE